jgi:hypothetical protein
VSQEDKDVLLWCGAMGHRYVVIIDDDKSASIGPAQQEKGRRCLAETGSMKRAKSLADEYADRNLNPTIYSRVQRGWRRRK